MKFSILVPVYNVEEYLTACADSLLKQTYSDLEIIFVDDGSTDSSGVICDGYAAHFPDKIRVLHQKNQGQLLARANGIRHAAGDVLLFVDSDDCLRPDTLELLERRFRETGCDLILFNASTRPDYSVPYRKYPFSDGQLFQGASKKSVFELLVCTSDLNNLCLKAAKRSIVDANRSWDAYAFVKNGEDLLVSMQILTDAQKILFLDQNLYYYRQRSGSVIHTFQAERAASVRAVHLQLEQYISKWGYLELHALHYGREVRGWVETLFLLHEARAALAPGVYREQVCVMADDPYFRNAYEKMDASRLRKVPKICAKLLYERKYWALRLLLGIRGLRPRCMK